LFIGLIKKGKIKIYLFNIYKNVRKILYKKDIEIIETVQYNIGTSK